LHSGRGGQGARTHCTWIISQWVPAAQRTLSQVGVSEASAGATAAAVACAASHTCWLQSPSGGVQIPQLSLQQTWPAPQIEGPHGIEDWPGPRVALSLPDGAVSPDGSVPVAAGLEEAQAHRASGKTATAMNRVMVPALHATNARATRSTRVEGPGFPRSALESRIAYPIRLRNLSLIAVPVAGCLEKADLSSRETRRKAFSAAC
jgi:hypothetical protein